MNSSFTGILRYSRICLRSRTIQYKPFRLSTRPNSIRNFSNHHSETMAAAQDLLTTKLKSLSVTIPLKKYPNCYPEINPVDVYRAHLTEILTEVTGVDAAIIYPSLQWTQTLEKGDLVLPVPALRVKGKKPPELAAEWVEKVCSILPHCPVILANSLLSSSSPSLLSSTSQQ